jgi:hypothetical protein
VQDQNLAKSENLRKSHGKKRFGIKSLQKLFSARFKEIEDAPFAAHCTAFSSGCFNSDAVQGKRTLMFIHFIKSRNDNGSLRLHTSALQDPCGGQL